MIFLQPDQVMVPGEDEIVADSKGWTILFHPDLIRSYSLGEQIREFNYFSYEANEALHLSEDEKESLTEIAKK